MYNLVYSGIGARPVSIDNHQVVGELVAKVQDWEQDDNCLPLMAYMFHHQYCKASLSFKLLKVWTTTVVTTHLWSAHRNGVLSPTTGRQTAVICEAARGCRTALPPAYFPPADDEVAGD